MSITHTEKFQTLCIVYPKRFVDIALFLRYMHYGSWSKRVDIAPDVYHRIHDAMQTEALAIHREIIQANISSTNIDVRNRLIDSARQIGQSNGMLSDDTLENLMLAGKSRVYCWMQGDISKEIPPGDLYRIAEFFHLKPQFWYDSFDSQQSFEASLRSHTYHKRYGHGHTNAFELAADEEDLLREIIDKIETFLSTRKETHAS